MKKRKPNSWRLNPLAPISDPVSADFDKLLEQAESTGALVDPVVQQLLFALKATPGDPAITILLIDAMNPYVMEDKMNPNALRPYPDFSSRLDFGEINIGNIHETGVPWKIPIDDYPHMAILGRTRGGKSYALYGQLQDMHRKLPYLLITIKNDTSRFLVDPPIADKVVRFEELRISLFTPPPGIEAKQWHLDVVELLCRQWNLQYARSPLHQAADQLRAEFEALSKTRGTSLAFSLSNLKAQVRKTKSKYAEGAASVLDMLLRTTGDVFECSQGMPVEKLLLSGSNILLIPNITDDRVAGFFVDWLMHYTYAYFRENGPDDGTPRLGFFLDDAHRFLTKEKDKNGMSSLSHMYLVIKQSGVCITAVSQCPDDLSPSVISQSAILKQVGGLNHENDLRTMCKAFGIGLKDADVLRHLKQGEFVALEQLGRYDRPFAGIIKRFPPPSGAFSESDRVRMMTPILNAFPSTPTIHPDATSSTSPKQPLQSPSLSNTALALAIDVLAYPWSFMTDRYFRLGIQGRTANGSKQELIDRAWVRQFTIPRKGGNPILLEPLTPLANGLNRPLPSYGKGGYLHAFLQHTVANKLKSQGYTSIELEKFYGAKGVDLVAIAPNGDLVGFEMTISKGNVESNFVKDFAVQPRFTIITAVCITAKDATSVRNTLWASSALKKYHKRMIVDTVSRWL